MSTPTNGVAKSTLTVKPLPVGEKKETPPVPIKPLLQGEKLPPLDERLHRLNQLFEIQSKYNRLQTSLQKLKTFTFKKNGDYSGITIRDDGRNDFTTGNPEVVAEVVKFLISTIQSKIKELEPQLKW